MAERQAAP